MNVDGWHEEHNTEAPRTQRRTEGSLGTAGQNGNPEPWKILRTRPSAHDAVSAYNFAKSLNLSGGMPCIRGGMSVDPAINRLSWTIISCAIAVHRALGPGLLESVCSACLIVELRSRGLRVDVDVKVPVVYRGLKLVADTGSTWLSKILELKSLSVVLPIHEAQLLTYLKLTGKPLGLLLNFNVEVMKDGITRKINA